jgi:hypothetical protein
LFHFKSCVAGLSLAPTGDLDRYDFKAQETGGGPRKIVYVFLVEVHLPFPVQTFDEGIRIVGSGYVAETLHCLVSKRKARGRVIGRGLGKIIFVVL